MRIVVDTNVIASAVFFGGEPYQLLRYIMEGRVCVVASKDIVNEYEEIISRSCAVDGKCIYIVSGDSDLISIGNYGDIEILTVVDFLARMGE